MSSRAALLLVVPACALDFPSHFLRDADVAVEQLVDYDANAEFLEISSATGLPLHRYDASFGAHPYDAVVALPGDPAAYRQRGFHFGGADLPAAGPIGYAVNGVPIVPYYDGDGANAVEPPPGGAPADRDGCWGFRDPSSGAYVYRIAPPCLYGDDRGTYGSPAAAAHLGFGAAVAPGGTAAARARGRPGAVPLVGVMVDGFPLWGPLDADGNEHGDLDECGGKYDGRGRYAYYATAAPPYTIACFGPGVAAAAGLPPTPPASPGAGAVDAGPDCPAGRHVAAGACAACPAGRYALETPAGRAAYAAGSPARHCGGSCGLGAYCPAGTPRPDAAVPCPAGRFGDARGLATAACAGPCPRGHFCPPGTVAPRAHACGSEAVFCPAGAGAPRAAAPGSYTLPAVAAAPWAPPDDVFAWPEAEFGGAYAVGPRPAARCDLGDERNCTAAALAARPPRPTQDAEAPCEPGTFCVAGARFRCPAGRFGAVPGLDAANCSGACPPGSYCGEGAPAPILLPAGRYSAAAGLAAPGEAAECPPGSYCVAGSTAPADCPAGRFGRETDDDARDRRAPGVDAGNVGDAGALQGSEATHDADGTADEVGAWAPPEFLGPDRDYQWA